MGRAGKTRIKIETILKNGHTEKITVCLFPFLPFRSESRP
ncbi:hypothetical protein A11S_581 [Micavibrio aeruginosavorus EPB]|uniref:Uncharacterized protein n=1 Tax=Micavibrio aeruginosavorus EPB TaxID=349215 RepID=M4VFY7_9BACT|nr:hypothetical protein A11S_581 [Micavibrio aeruginosavorus EPB]